MHSISHAQTEANRKPEDHEHMQKEIRESIAILRTEIQDDMGRCFALVGGAAGQIENINEALQARRRLQLSIKNISELIKIF